MVIYSDYKSQEIHIAARKSRDPNMIKAIESDDAYMWFARERGMVPPDATKQSHKDFRDRILETVQSQCELRFRRGRYCHSASRKY